MKPNDRTIVIALRAIGALDMLSFAAAVMPFEWMQWTHQALGLGVMPKAPIAEYLARSTSIFYAIHAATLFFLSMDVARYRPVIRFLALLALMHGLFLLWSDLKSGMPYWWVAAETCGVMFEGILILSLLALVNPQPKRPQPSASPEIHPKELQCPS